MTAIGWDIGEMEAVLPTIYLTNWSSHRTPGRFGPGLTYTIMVRPRPWEYGAGTVEAFVPPAAAMRQAKAGEIPFNAYAALLSGLWVDVAVEPGALVATARTGVRVPVRHGDTLCCACAVGKPCHRLVAAKLLHRAGWRVVLDGQEWAP